MPRLTSSTAGAWVPPATSGLLLGGMPAIAPATHYDEDDPRTWPFERFMQHQRDMEHPCPRYALCPVPWGWHMKRVPPLRSPLLPRIARAAALVVTVIAGCVGLLALGAWLDA